MLEGLWTLENMIALITLAGLEIVLGIDNIVFVVVVTNKLPEASRAAARRLGIGLAMFTRIGLLLIISAIMGLTAPLFTVFGHVVAGRDIVLLVGGLFLLAKATHEIHDKLEEPDERDSL
ncbi:MAG: TerC family protein, partial [Desulfobacterales bacterium]|nr:TerC family protein [Desulfobacterales bacterium]